MNNVFLSYSSKHRALTERLRDYLSGKGLTVWYDQDSLEARGPFDGQIRAGLQQAEAVVVIWTTDAIVSEWVNFEASYADDRRKLINVEPAGIDRSKLPARFRDHHRHVQSELRPLDMEKIFHDVLAVREGRPLPAEVSLRTHYENKYDELILDIKRRPLPSGFVETPAMLLQAKYGIVGFIDTSSLHRELVDFALGTNSDPKPSGAFGRLIHGAGGTGKTRLLIEVTATLREHGWSAGFLNRLEISDRHPDKPKMRAEALAQLITNADDSGLAIVVDYAEGRSNEVRWLACQLREAAIAMPNRPLCMFLLAREVGEWWDILRRQDPAVTAMFTSRLGCVAETVVAEATSAECRRALFCSARKAFGEALSRNSLVDVNTSEPTATQLARLERDSAYGRPLAVLMEALLHVYSKSVLSEECRMAALLDQVVDLEIEHWTKVVPGVTETRELHRGTAQVTLVGGTESRAESLSLLMEDPYYKPLRLAPAATESALSTLARFYGNGCGGLSALEPDLLGEHLVLTEAQWDHTLARQLVNACLDWNSPNASRSRTVITVINRATKAEHGVKARIGVHLLTDMLRTDGARLAKVMVEVALAEPDGRIPEIFADNIGCLDDPAIAAVSDAIPHPTKRLLAAAILFDERRVAFLSDREHLKSQSHHTDTEAAQLADYAAVKNRLAVRLSEAGRNEEALKAYQETAAIYALLAKERPFPYQSELATVQLNVSNRFNVLGQSDRALNLSELAVDQLEVLWLLFPDMAAPLLSQALTARSAQLSLNGQNDEAIATAQQAVEVLQKLPQNTSNELYPHLASALSAYGAALFNAGRAQESLNPLREALVAWRSLANSNPDSFRSHLAGCLINAGMTYRELRDFDAAFAAFTDAAQIIHAEQTFRTAQFFEPLANELFALAVELGKMRHPNTTHAFRSSIEISKLVAGDNPAQVARIAHHLEILSTYIYNNEGRFLDGIAVARDALSLLVGHTEAHPELITSINPILEDLRVRAINGYVRNPEVMIAAFAAISDTLRTLCRQGRAELHEAFLQALVGLCAAYNRAGTSFLNTGRRLEAVTPFEQAVTTFRELAGFRPDDRLHLASHLRALGVCLVHASRNSEALSAFEEAAAIYRDFIKNRPGPAESHFLKDIIACNDTVASILLEQGRHTEALPVVDEGLRLLEQLGEPDLTELANTANLLRNRRAQIASA